MAEKGGQEMNAISIQAPSTLWDTWKNIIFQHWAVLEEGRWRWKNINDEMDRQQRRKKKSRCAWYLDCLLFKLASLLIKMLYLVMQTHFQAEATDIDGFRTTAVSYATSALLHQTHMHAELEKKRHTLSVTLRVRVLAHDVPASGPQARRFDMLHLPHSVTQRSSFAHLVAAWVCLWSSETKPKKLAICFMCSRLKPPTQQQQQQKPQTTGGYSHICYSDLGHYHFIVWHTICIKQ